MSNYDDSNKGAIWGNDKKETEKHPDFRGQANVDGTEYWVAAWKRGPNDNPKSPALRFSFTPKDDQPKQSARDQPSAYTDDDIDDRIPF